jgi:hypothetical protein
MKTGGAGVKFEDDSTARWRCWTDDPHSTADCGTLIITLSCKKFYDNMIQMYYDIVSQVNDVTMNTKREWQWRSF